MDLLNGAMIGVGKPGSEGLVVPMNVYIFILDKLLDAFVGGGATRASNGGTKISG